MSTPTNTPPSPVKKNLLILLNVVGAILILMIGSWVFRTYTLSQPYDEMWIALNKLMPGPLRSWSCGQVKARFPQPGLPPLGCEAYWK